MIGALIGAGVSAASGLIGGLTSAAAARRQKRRLEKAEARNEAIYNRDYYTNYLDTTQAQAAIRRVEDTMRRRNQQAQAQAAITGGTQEGVIAQQNSDQQLMGGVVSDLAERGDAAKDAATQRYLAAQEAIDNGQIAQAQATEQGNAQLMSSGLGLIGDALAMTNWGGSSNSSAT